MIIGANPAAVRLLRRSRTEILGCAGDDARWAIAGFEGEHVASRDLPIFCALRGEEPQPMAISMAGSDGQRLLVRQSATPVRGADGRVEGAIVALTDIGDAHRARADVLAKERMLGRGRLVAGDDGVRRTSGMISDITERKRIELARRSAQEALALSEERFRLAVEGTGAGVYDVDLATGEAAWTADLFKVLGYLYSPGGHATRTMFWDVVHPDDIQAVRSAQARERATRGPLVVEFRIRRADTNEERWLSAYGRTFQVAGVHRRIGIMFDITKRKRAEERERLLMREVDHRAKNALAVVQSILQLTPHDDVETYIASVAGRIGAVARVHTLLAEDGWVSASVKALIEAELAAYRQQAALIEISGPDAAAPPHAAQAITMIVHELTTNAAKYGALSTREGRLSISLGYRGDDMTIDWVEHMPHPAPQPAELGFGGRLVTTLAEQHLDGAFVRTWSTNGLSVRLTVPGLGPLPTASVETPREEAVQAQSELTGRAILLVEDDPLVSMALEQTLKDAGARVRAFHTVDDALSSVRRAPPDLAVLNVNVRGVPVTPVATELTRHSVPFVYVTGYGDDLKALPHGAIVRKPLAPGAVRAALQRLAGAK
jgi:PAS domain S-box-containing protein